MISPALTPYLDDLEARIDAEQEARLLREWTDFAEGRHTGPVFAPGRRASQALAGGSGCTWPRVTVNAALHDPDLMMLQQYGECAERMASASGYLLNVRANYGSSILPCLFGMVPYEMAEELNTLPTSRPLNNGEAIRRLVDAGIPDLRQGYGAQVLAMGERYAEVAAHYPGIGRYVMIYHPDLQGPMDACEVIWGSSIFYALYDCPELVHALLELVTQTYIRFMRAWLAIVPFRSGNNVHWGLLYRGNIMLRDDSAMNLSRAMFDEFVRPYDRRLLTEFGGGAIHFCGKGDHYIASLAEMDGVYAVNLSQPEYNNMEFIYNHTIDRGIKLVGLNRGAAETALAMGRDLRGRVHAA